MVAVVGPRVGPYGEFQLIAVSCTPNDVEVKMKSDRVPQEIEDVSTIIRRGFFIRLLWGLFGIPLYILIRPEVISENPTFLIPALCMYSVVCLAGGLLDVFARHKRRITLWMKPKPWQVLLLMVVIIMLALDR